GFVHTFIGRLTSPPMFRLANARKDSTMRKALLTVLSIFVSIAVRAQSGGGTVAIGVDADDLLHATAAKSAPATAAPKAPPKLTPSPLLYTVPDDLYVSGKTDRKSVV